MLDPPLSELPLNLEVQMYDDAKRRRLVKMVQKLLDKAAIAHHDFEEEIGHEDEKWSRWYADYMVREIERLADLQAAQ